MRTGRALAIGVHGDPLAIVEDDAGTSRPIEDRRLPRG